MGDIHVIERKDDDPGGENWRGKLIEHARQIAAYDQTDSELVGYVVIGLFSDGAHSIGWRYNPDKSPIPRRLLPAYIEELVREDVITGDLVERRALAD